MDNLTHSLIGLAAAKAGLQRLSPGTTTLCVLAANAPDSDIVVLLVGRWEFLQHHRGITHSIVGAFALALALPIIFCLGDRVIARLRQRSPRCKLKGLILASLLVTATHPIMDWTNNYGMRFLLPWNPRWFYGDFVFIIDPVLWMILGGAAFLLTATTIRGVILWVVVALVPSFIVMVGAARYGELSEGLLLQVFWIGALVTLIVLYRHRIGQRYGAKVALAALVTSVLYCVGLAATHAVALRQAKAQAADIAISKTEKVIKVAAMPTMANPAGWLCLLETDRANYRFSLSLLHPSANPSNVVRYAKSTGSAEAVVAKAAHDPRAQVFLGFARFPVERVVGEDCATQTLVQFADLRYTEPGKSRGTFALDVPVECPVLDELNR